MIAVRPSSLAVCFVCAATALAAPGDPQIDRTGARRAAVTPRITQGASADIQNDRCEGAIRLTLPDQEIFHLDDATPDNAPTCQGVDNTTAGMWYSVIGTGNVLFASTCTEFCEFDTRISVYCAGCDELTCVTANDDDCTEYTGTESMVSWCSEEGVEYLLLVHGADSGGCILSTWDTDVACNDAPNCEVCDLVCEGTPEDEPDCGLPIDTVNGGCNSAPPAFSRIECGQTVCGTAGMSDSARDTDWYVVSVDEPTLLVWHVEAEFPFVIGLAHMDPLGIVDCDVHDGSLNPIAEGGRCEERLISICVGPGKYALFVAPSFATDPFDCGKEYQATLSCDDCVSGGCCIDLPGPTNIDTVCAELGQRDCEFVFGGMYGGDGTTCGDRAIAPCCLDDGVDLCRNTSAFCCELRGGQLSPSEDPVCLGDEDFDGIDEACQLDEPCECGPGAHWVDGCMFGMDNMTSGATVGIDIDFDCIPDTNVVLRGPVHVRRFDPRDDSAQFPGLRPTDGHIDVMDTQIEAMLLTGGGVTLRAGTQYGLQYSRGAIAEQMDDPTMADSFFDVFFEVEFSGLRAYNHVPLHVESIIDCVPPNTSYIHPTECIPLYDTPLGSAEPVHVGNIVTAIHSTFLECGDPATGDCRAPNGTPFCDDAVCCELVCNLMPYCCEVEWSDNCAGLAEANCVPRHACCLRGDCIDGLTPDECINRGGIPQGPDTVCTAELCEPDDACEDCGPWPHWVDQCAGGMDHMDTGALVGIDIDLDCRADTSLVMHGPVWVRRSDPMQDSLHYPGISPVDGHLDVIDTEMVSMSLSRGPISLIAGAGLGNGGMLAPSLGAIVEQPDNDLLADSFFDVFFEVDLGGGQFAYNRVPLRVQSVIDCLPPDAHYIHPVDCIPLYQSPGPGGPDVVIANLVTADHSTYPECGDPTTGSCFEPHTRPFCNDATCCDLVCDMMPYCCEVEWSDNCAGLAEANCEPRAACCLRDGRCEELTLAECRELQGRPHPAGSLCAGDGDGNGIDDICEAEDPCDDCGPGAHWVDECPNGADTMTSSALVGIDLTGDCLADTSVVMSGSVHVRRTDPMDDSATFPNLRPVDQHLDVIDTRVVWMDLTGDGLRLLAGEGYGAGGVLPPSPGAIAEIPGNPTIADSFFDVFFEIDLGGGDYAYNHEPLKVESVIDCLPPDATYIHPTGCLPLYDSPEPGSGNVVARLVSANHSTYPACGDPGTGSCFEPHDSPFCDDAFCCRTVCQELTQCCDTMWGPQCAALAEEVCPQCERGTVEYIDPPSGFYDARQPHPVDDALALQGVNELHVQAPPRADHPACWDLCETNNNPAMHPGYLPNWINHITDDGGGNYTIHLGRPITQAELTTVEYLFAPPDPGMIGLFWYLPGDADADHTSAPADILAVIDSLNGITPLPQERCDMDRDGTCAPADILRVIDLLNGAAQFGPYLNVQINRQGCPH